MSTFSEFLKNSRQFTAEAQIEAAAEAAPIEKRWQQVPFYINRLNHNIPDSTRRWIRSEADERAAIVHGCRFYEEVGMYAVEWQEENCVLYEGDLAGTAMVVDDWQFELNMQMFGWQVFDEEWEQRRAGSGWVRRYKVISGWVPKKNAKSPTLASIGLYLFCGDGEHGQKCFSLATTRDQALISHTHALNFIRQSPKLASHCRINGSDDSIFDHWTNSRYSILCGDKGLLTTSKEGINGSLIIDETHVVSRALMYRVTRAGISRRQPVRLQLSTAGDDTAGFGYEQYTIGVENLKAANEGRDFNHRWLHLEYAIPQDTSIDDLRDKSKIESLIRLANPTLGRIVRLQEAKEDWQSSLRSDTELIRFAMYRLNQWNTGGGAFIAGADWNRCKKPITIDELKGYPCIIGVDMSSVRDMTAVVAIWAIPKVVMIPENEFDPDSRLIEREINVPVILPNFYVPRRSVGSYAGKLNIEDLHKRKQVRITQSNTVRPEVIAEHIGFLDRTFDVRGVASDPYMSRALAAALAAHHGWDVEGENSRFFLIPQNANTLTPAIEQIRGCVLNQELIHTGHDVLSWQLSNIVLVEDQKGAVCFQKPQRNDYRKIDGWAAIANGFTYMMNDPDMYPGRPLSISFGAKT